MNNDKLQEIFKAIGRLEGQTETGFKSIIDRLDRMNGSIDEHTKCIDDLQADNNNMKGKMTGIGLVASFIGGIIGLLASYFNK